jgi:transglutaminase-like putative cysteine protease
VRSLGPHEAEITVRSLRPGEVSPPGNAKRKIEPAPPEYRQANSVLQIDDPTVRQMAQDASSGQQDPTKVALALEKYVHDHMSASDLSQAFGTAAEVARSQSGDCTEHAVLLAALARACDIAARVAIGLVYVDRAQAFGYHMWTEVYLDGAWVPLDATLGQGSIGAAHLKLVDSSLEGATAYSAFLPVAQVVGQLKIKVLEAE